MTAQDLRDWVTTHTGPTPAEDAATRGRRRGVAQEGSLRRAAGWTLLGSAVPGSGLLPTRLRSVGLVMIVVVGLLLAALAALLLFGDPTDTGLRLASRRPLVIAVMVMFAFAGLIWMLQILLTNQVHNLREHLQGRKRILSLVLAVVMVVTVAVPVGRGVQSLWAMQGLLGNRSVFGGSGDGRLADGPDPWKDVGRINVMMLGQDAGDDREGTRPDTLMVASIDTETGRTALFSIPRNLQWVPFPEGTVEAEAFPDGFDYFGRNQNLINAVWTWAEEREDLFPGDPNPGLTATTHAVEGALGLDIDYYAMVDLQGFEDLVDAIGGVRMDVERRIPIGGGINQATGGSYPITGWIEAGDQTLDGYHALWYARSREGSDDFDRICRQQRMVRVVSEEANPTTLALAFPRLVTATENNIKTDIPPERLDAFVDLALRLQDTGFQSYPITPEVTPPGRPDFTYLHDWVDASIEDSMSSMVPESVAAAPAEDTETTAPAEEETTAPEDDATSPAEETPTPEETTAETQEPTEDATAGTEDPTPEAPTIDQDPLQSCMPGGQDEEE
ncbi:MAG: LCP family protein [Brachybacterium sp.]|nr:LCP family protein [Brachybacterium sp.]